MSNECKHCGRFPCYCDGPYGPLSDVYYDEDSLATVYLGDYRYKVFYRSDSYRIEVDATIYNASSIPAGRYL